MNRVNSRSDAGTPEPRPVGHRRSTAEQLVERHRELPRIDCAQMRQEAGEFFGSEDQIGDA